MRLLRTILIDDEQNGVDALRILIEKYVPNIKIVAESTSPVEAIKLIEIIYPKWCFSILICPK
jgi:hypothetical protein